MNKRVLILGYVGSAVLALAIGVFVFQFEGEEKGKAQALARQLASAIESDAPAKAPDGAAGYVRGAREAYGRVRRARVLTTYKKRVGEGRRATSSTVSELLVRARRGAAVMELQFDRGETKVTGMSELAPGDVEADLDGAESAAVRRGFEARGATAAKITVLDGTFTRGGDIREDPTTSASAPPRKRRKVRDNPVVAKARGDANDRLACVRNAAGDVIELQGCAQP